jgi:hypothetical protein
LNDTLSGISLSIMMEKWRGLRRANLVYLINETDQ